MKDKIVTQLIKLIVKLLVRLWRKKYPEHFEQFEKIEVKKLSDDQFIFMQNLATLIRFCTDQGIKITGGELFRTREQQLIYFETGKSKTMNSNHLRRLAIDLNFFFDGVYSNDWNKIKPIGDFWKSLHPKNRWGGDFNNNDKRDGFIDVPHFEMNI